MYGGICNLVSTRSTPFVWMLMVRNIKERAGTGTIAMNGIGAVFMFFLDEGWTG